MIRLFTLGIQDALPGIYKPRQIFKRAGLRGYLAYHAGFKIGSKFN
jgi:hypothetical protein